MAHRKNKNRQRVDSSEVQGDGSYVVLERITWGLMEELLPQAEQLGQRETAMLLIPRLVVDWDWVDDDDNPLPKPKEDPEVFKRLNDQEITFLLKAMNLDGTAGLKN